MEQYFQILFKLDEGRVRIWRVIIDIAHDSVNNSQVSLRFVHGLLSGKKVRKNRPITSKNIGKSNETSSIQQAHLVAESEWKKQRDKGYKSYDDLGISYEVTSNNFRNVYYNGKQYLENKTTLERIIPEAFPKGVTDASGRIKPMTLYHGRLPEYVKGDKMFGKSKVMTFPAYVQPKVDGVCSLSDREFGLTTRGGKDRLTPKGDSWNDICPQIVSAVKALNVEWTLHGEVYKHGMTLQEITSACKKKYPESKEMVLHIFDVVCDLAQEYRIDKLRVLEQKIKNLGLDNILKVVPTYFVGSMEALLEHEEMFLEQGYEGLVYRRMEGMYKEGKKSSDVLKIVRFDSSEVQIIDVIPMTNEPTHGLLVVSYNKVKTWNEAIANKLQHNAVLFKLTPSELNHAERIDLLTNKSKYIGKYATINHRGFTDDGVPRIATFKSFREANT